MKYYRVRTREQWNWLMKKLEDEGYEWITTRDKPTEKNFWPDYRERTVVEVREYIKGTSYSDINYYQGILPESEEIIEVSTLMEPKFKVGEFVKVVKNPAGMKEDTIGGVDKVVKAFDFDEEGWSYRLPNGFWYSSDELEPVPVVKEPALKEDDSLEQKALERNNKSKELVNHPDHYQGNKFEVIDIIEDYDLNFTLGSAIKYILRAGKKDDKETDLRKAVWMIERELEEEK